MKNIFKVAAIAITTSGLTACGNTNVPYTRTQGTFGGAVAGAVLSKTLGVSKEDGLLIGAVVGNLTGNPCERVVRDNLGTPGIDVSQVQCSGTAAQGYNMNGAVAPQGYYQQQPQRGTGIFGAPGFR